MFLSLSQTYGNFRLCKLYQFLCPKPIPSPFLNRFMHIYVDLPAVPRYFLALQEKYMHIFYSLIHFSLNLKYLAPCLDRHAKPNEKFPNFLLKTTFYMESMQLYTYIWGFNKGTAFTCLLPTPRTGGGSVLPSVGQATGWG